MLLMMQSDRGSGQHVPSAQAACSINRPCDHSTGAAAPTHVTATATIQRLRNMTHLHSRRARYCVLPYRLLRVVKRREGHGLLARSIEVDTDVNRSPITIPALYDVP
jgi:hypothetical protein